MKTENKAINKKLDDDANDRQKELAAIKNQIQKEREELRGQQENDTSMLLKQLEKDSGTHSCIPRTLLFTFPYIGRHEHVTNVAREHCLSNIFINPIWTGFWNDVVARGGHYGPDPVLTL